MQNSPYLDNPPGWHLVRGPYGFPVLQSKSDKHDWRFADERDHQEYRRREADRMEADVRRMKQDARDLILSAAFCRDTPDIHALTMTEARDLLGRADFMGRSAKATRQALESAPPVTAEQPCPIAHPKDACTASAPLLNAVGGARA